MGPFINLIFFLGSGPIVLPVPACTVQYGNNVVFVLSHARMEDGELGRFEHVQRSSLHKSPNPRRCHFRVGDRDFDVMLVGRY